MSDNQATANMTAQGLNPDSADKFTWKEGDVTIYNSREEWEAAMVKKEIARTDALLRDMGVDPDDPEATLGNLDEDDE